MGRPLGSKNKKTLIREQIEKFGPDLMQIIERAARGDGDRPPDMTAALALLARLDPVVKPRSQPIEFDLNVTAPLAKQMEQVTQAVAAGELTIEEGKTIADMLRQLADIRAVDELEARLTALEAKRQ